MGLFGFAGYSIKRRTKEIGIRKVNGATATIIMVLLNKDFIKWVFVAFLIGSPVAYYLINKWLQNYAYKTQMSWWVFALSGLIVLLVAVITVSWQSWRAARQNPVDSLRYE
jgi:putative ABC transport system permease protein